GDAAADQGVAIAGERLMFGVRDLAGQAEAARWIAMRAGVALHEDAMEDGVLGIVNPVFFGQVGPADADMDAADRDEAQIFGGSANFRWRFIAHNADQQGERHRADHLLVGNLAAVIECDDVAARRYARDPRVHRERALEMRQNAVPPRMEAA